MNVIFNWVSMIIPIALCVIGMNVNWGSISFMQYWECKPSKWVQIIFTIDTEKMHSVVSLSVFE